MVKGTALLHKELIPGEKPLGIKFSLMGVLALAAAVGAIMMAIYLARSSSAWLSKHIPSKAGGEQEGDFMAHLMG
ncbi:hypothetical protein KAU11_03070 [Candidatus Babeliales bacterium]|nr:hypothetical protein [Candidatus Babeliales bacterium]